LKLSVAVDQVPSARHVRFWPFSDVSSRPELPFTLAESSQSIVFAGAAREASA